MLNTYSTPTLVAQGNVVETTKTFGFGTGDPEGTFRSMTPGSVGFML